KSHAQKDDQGSSSQSSGWSASYKGGKAKLGAERTSSTVVKDPDLGGKVVESQDRTSRISAADGKLELGPSRTDQTEADGQTSTKGRSTTIGSDGSLVTSRTSSKTFRDDTGEHTQTRGTSVSASRDGATFGHERTKDGTSSSVSAAIDAKKGTGTLGGSYGV